MVLIVEAIQSPLTGEQLIMFSVVVFMISFTAAAPYIPHQLKCLPVTLCWCSSSSMGAGIDCNAQPIQRVDITVWSNVSDLSVIGYM